MHAELTGIGPYRLTAMLAAEDTQTIYAGHAESDPDRRVTVAVLHAALAADRKVLAAFETRARVALKLKHVKAPGAATGRDRGVASGPGGDRPWVVWDPVDGLSLEQLIAQKKRFKLAEDGASNLILSVLDALAAVGKEGIAHGHLRASDIWLSADGDVRVANFGAEGDARMDFLALGRIAAELGTDWSPEVNAWLDALQREEPPWRDAAAARAAFPAEVSEAGLKRLQRMVRGALKKLRPEPAPEVPRPPATPPAEAQGPAPRAPKRARRAMSPQELERAARQAKVVALICLGIMALGLGIAVF